MGDTGGFFVFLYFHFLSAVTETYIRWKKSQRVCHTPRQRWGRDTGYSRELADARAENETLRADVAAGRKRLRINANCPGSLRKAPITSGVDNATGPRLAEAAERDYFILRERLMAMQKQLEGAQEYIRTQCIP